LVLAVRQALLVPMVATALILYFQPLRLMAVVADHTEAVPAHLFLDWQEAVEQVAALRGLVGQAIHHQPIHHREVTAALEPTLVLNMVAAVAAALRK
jgi:hypothetical protein